MSARCGIGYDLHRLEPGRKLIIGGIEVPFFNGTVFARRGPVTLALRTGAALVPACVYRQADGTLKLIIEPDGLVIDRKVVRSKYLWAAFQGVEIQKNAVILPIDNGIGIIIPASAFSSDAERYDFAAVVSKHLKERS